MCDGGTTRRCRISDGRGQLVAVGEVGRARKLLSIIMVHYNERENSQINFDVRPTVNKLSIVCVSGNFAKMLVDCLEVVVNFPNGSFGILDLLLYKNENGEDF